MENRIAKNQDGNFVLTGKANIGLDNGFTNESLGEHGFTMELFVFDGSTVKSGFGSIEWDIPSLEITEHIGVNWEGGFLDGYDGVFELPPEAIELLEHFGLDCAEFK